MTAAGRAIITGIQVLPPTEYGEYRFRHDIKRTIESVIGKGPKVEKTIQRMAAPPFSLPELSLTA